MQCHCERDLRMRLMAWAGPFEACHDLHIIFYPFSARYGRRDLYNSLKSDLFGVLVFLISAFKNNGLLLIRSSAKRAALERSTLGATS